MINKSMRFMTASRTAIDIQHGIQRALEIRNVAPLEAAAYFEAVEYLELYGATRVTWLKAYNEYRQGLEMRLYRELEKESPSPALRAEVEIFAEFTGFLAGVDNLVGDVDQRSCFDGDVINQLSVALWGEGAPDLCQEFALEGVNWGSRWEKRPPYGAVSVHFDGQPCPCFRCTPKK